MNNIFRRSILIVLFLAFMFSSFPYATFAEDNTLIENNVNSWLNSFGSITLRDFRWTENDVQYSAFFMDVPNMYKNDWGYFGYADGKDAHNKLTYTDNDGIVQNAQISIKVGGKDILKRQQSNYFEDYGRYMIEINPNIIEEGDSVRQEVNSYKENGPAEITIRLADGTEITKDIPIGNVVVENLSEESGIVKFFKTLGNILFKPIEEALKLLEKILNGLILVCADNILASVCKAVGESVTIDSVVLGQTEKISIDFWGATSGTSSVASMLKNVVNYWYGIFRSIALIVYFIVLLIIGIKVLIASTGTAKAKYKDLIKDWIVGIALLLLFPHAMKMIVDVNDILVKYVASTGYTPTEGIKISAEDSPSKFGEDDFVSAATGSESKPGRKNTMMYVRFLAGKQGRIPLAIVYCIMIFQLIVILCVYYKRVFMLAFLITIFPLVAMTYTVDKLRRRAYKNKCFQHLAKGVLRECACSNFSCNYICDNC